MGMLKVGGRPININKAWILKCSPNMHLHLEIKCQPCRIIIITLRHKAMGPLIVNYSLKNTEPRVKMTIG